MALPATDSFSGGDGSPGANWTLSTGSMTVVSGRLRSNGSGVNFAYWNADSFNSDHYSEATFFTDNNDGGKAAGVAVRIQSSGDNGYCFQASGNNSRNAFRVDSANRTQIGASGSGSGSGEVLKMEFSGTTFTCYIGGSATSQPTGTDSTYSGGAAGCYGLNASSVSAELDFWTGDDLGGGGGSTFKAAWAINSNVVIQ